MNNNSISKKVTINKISALFSIILLSGCSTESVCIEKPKDTNLKYWLTQSVTEKELSTMELVGYGYGTDVYLDNNYNLDSYKGPFNLEEDNIYVTYMVSRYPDISSTSFAIIGIEITDPSIHFYDISLLSSKEEICNRMKNLCYEYSRTEDYYLWSNDKYKFIFQDNKINLYAKVTNKNNIIY